MAWTLPERLAATCKNSVQGSAWLDRLPAVVADVARRWGLTLGAPFEGVEGSSAWVAPALRADGSSAVLKMSMPHMEAEHELDGLRFWDGEPTVRLLEADDEVFALLLERCEPGFPLRGVSEPEQDWVIAGLLRRLWRVPPAKFRFRPLSTMTTFWSERTRAQAEHWPDAGLVQEGLNLFSELPRNAARSVLLATDLHAGNVLRAAREPWLVIDPKPFFGDPAYDATQHLFNCADRLRSNPDRMIRGFAELLGVDEARVRLWLFARAAAEPRDDWRTDPWLAFARKIAA